MILTARFGALAGRRSFPHFDETEQEPTVDLPSAEAKAKAELEAEMAEMTEMTDVGSTV